MQQADVYIAGGVVFCIDCGKVQQQQTKYCLHLCNAHKLCNINQHAIGLLQVDSFAVMVFMLVALVYTHLYEDATRWQHCVNAWLSDNHTGALGN